MLSHFRSSGKFWLAVRILHLLTFFWLFKLILEFFKFFEVICFKCFVLLQEFLCLLIVSNSNRLIKFRSSIDFLHLILSPLKNLLFLILGLN